MNEQKAYTVFCDESCHLQYDNSNVMCIGGIVVPDEFLAEYKDAIKQIKRKHGILHEIKWNTMSETHLEMYKELIRFFFSSEMMFRCILIKNKHNIAAHTLNRQEYNEFYFSIVERLIRFTIQHNGTANGNFRFFLDLKDTHGMTKLSAIEKRISGQLTNGNQMTHLQNIRSHESVFIQLADIFIGAVTYISRGLKTSTAKIQIASLIENLSGYNLGEGTEPGDCKFSIYDFQPKRRTNG